MVGGGGGERCRACLKSCIIQLRWFFVLWSLPPYGAQIRIPKLELGNEENFYVNFGLKHSSVSQLYPTQIPSRVLAWEGCKHWVYQEFMG